MMTERKEMYSDGNIKWSEFHYHLFSWLIDKETPRELAMGIELQLFPTASYPNEALLEEYLAAFARSTSPEDFLDLAKQLYNDNLLENQEPICPMLRFVATIAGGIGETIWDKEIELEAINIVIALDKVQDLVREEYPDASITGINQAE